MYCNYLPTIPFFTLYDIINLYTKKMHKYEVNDENEENIMKLQDLGH